MNDEEVLKALAQADRDLEAPPELEIRLHQAFRSKMRRRQAGFIAWSIAAAAAIAIALIALYPRAKHVAPAVAVVEAPQITQPVSIAKSVAPVRTAPRKPRRAPPAEVVTDFFPLVDLAPPLDRGALVRVSLPAAAMRTVGLPVREDRLADRVNADVLVSEEGVATAIRFVKSQ